jgi:hypothetical protein
MHASLAALALAALAAAEPCAAPPGFTPRERLVAGEVVVLYRTRPAAIELGRHFSVEAIVCDAQGEPGGLRVDALMPEHRHGMNYRARVTPAGGGRYVAEGLMFHMPGRWQLLFDVERSGRTERLATDIILE